ncbi:amino acid ABC transporter ATP-binding/permease protein, partial [Mycetocola reblochoni]
SARHGTAAWLVRQCRGLLAPLAAATAFGVLNAATGVVVLLAAAGALLAVLGGGSPVPALIAIVAASLVKAGARYLEQYLGHRVAFSALARLRVLFFRALTPQSPAIAASARSGELSGIATRDIDRVEVFFAHTLPPAVIAVVVPLGAVAGTALALSPLLALPLLIAWLLVVAVIPWLGARRTAADTAALAERTGALAQRLGEQLQGAREIQAAGAEDAEAGRLASLADSAADSDRAIAARRAIRGAGVEAVQLSGHLAVVALGIAAGIDGASVFLALAVSLGVARPSRAVDGFAADLSASLAAAARLRTAMERPPAVTDARPEAAREHADTPIPTRTPTQTRERAPLVTVDGASLVLDGRPILDAVAWELPRGGRHAVVGASGSGKSSLLALLLRVYDPATGRILLDGEDLRELPLAGLRRRIALTGQRPDIFSGTLREALRLRSPDADDEALLAALRVAVLDDWLASQPQGLDTPIRQGGRTLSGGQRQRLALARSVVEAPELLVLDESTGQLDDATETELRRRLQRWAEAESVTVLEVTHRIERVLDADGVLVLDAGRVVEHGDPAVLAAGDGPFARLLSRRMG